MELSCGNYRRSILGAVNADLMDCERSFTRNEKVASSILAGGSTKTPVQPDGWAGVFWFFGGRSGEADSGSPLVKVSFRGYD